MKAAIAISEKQGVLVLPHQGLKQGDRIDSIVVRFECHSKKQFSYKKKFLDREFTVSADRLATVWQFKQEIARILSLRPIDL